MTKYILKGTVDSPNKLIGRNFQCDSYPRPSMAIKSHLNASPLLSFPSVGLFVWNDIKVHRPNDSPSYRWPGLFRGRNTNARPSG